VLLEEGRLPYLLLIHKVSFFKLNRVLFSLSFVVLLLLMFTSVASAAQFEIVPDANFVPDVTASSVISAIISFFIIISFIAAFFFLLQGGFQWVSSGGDEGKVESARNRITQAIIGLVIVVAVWALFGLVEDFLGVSVIGGGEITLPSLRSGGGSYSTQAECVQGCGSGLLTCLGGCGITDAGNITGAQATCIEGCGIPAGMAGTVGANCFSSFTSGDLKPQCITATSGILCESVNTDTGITYQCK